MRYLPILLITASLLTGCLAAAAGAAGGAVASGGNDDQVEYYINTEAPPDSIREAMRSERVIPGMTEAEARLTVQALRRHKDKPDHVIELDDGGKRIYYMDTHFGPATIITLNADGRVTKAETKRQKNVEVPE